MARAGDLDLRVRGRGIVVLLDGGVAFGLARMCDAPDSSSSPRLRVAHWSMWSGQVVEVVERRIRRLRLACPGLLTGAAATVAFALWAPGAAMRLMAEKPIPRCDLMIILEGGALERIASGLELHVDGACDNVLFTGESPGEVIARARPMLAGLDPRHRIHSDTLTRSTLGDALLAHDVATREGFDQLLVITSPYHTKRVVWIFSRVLDGTGIEFGVLASQSFYMDYDRWWETPYGRWGVVSEHAKLWLLGLAAQGLLLAASATALGLPLV